MSRRSSALVSVAVALGVAACGGSEDPERAGLERYMTQVNAIQGGYADELKRANEAYIDYSKAELEGTAAIAELRGAEATVTAARDRMLDLRPPSTARVLHERFVAYLDENVAFAHETTLLASYQDGAAAAVKPLDRVNRRLRSDLRRAKTPATQRRALAHFSTALDGMLAGLRALEVPAVLRPTHGDQVRRLASTRSLAVRLRRALADRDARLVARLLVRFRRAAGAREERTDLAAAAVRRYNDRYSSLNDAYRQIRREEIKLRRRFDT